MSAQQSLSGHQFGWIANAHQQLINEKNERQHGIKTEASGQLRWTQGNMEPIRDAPRTPKQQRTPRGPEQTLPMLVPAHRLADPDTYEHADQSAYRDLETMKRRKLIEAATGHESGTYIKTARMGGMSLEESIRTKGIENPIDIHPAGPTVMNGHHRIFLAEHISPTMEIPVQYEDY